MVSPVSCLFGQAFCCLSFQIGSFEEPGAVRKGVEGVDLACNCGQSERLGSDVEKCGCLGQVEPGLDPVGSRLVGRYLAVGSQRTDPFPGPAIAVAGAQAVPVENAGNEVVVGNFF